MSTSAVVESTSAPAARADGARRRFSDRLALAAIGVVVALVSLPRLRQFALRENEADAIRLVRLLSAHESSALDERSLRAALLERRVGDVEALTGGVVRRHGYLFECVRGPAGEGVVRAWPWNHQHTGLGAFTWSRERGFWAHANADGRFSGIERAPPPTPTDDGWVPFADAAAGQ